MSNNDLISREWLEDAFDNLCCHNCKTCRNFRIEDSFYKCALIDNAQTVEPQKEEKPQGKWEEHEDAFYCGGGYTLCTACEARFSFGAYHEVCDFKFCPECGAKMRKGGAE